VDRIGVEVEIVTEVEREVAGVVKESGGSYNGVLLSYLHVPWFVADVMVIVWRGLYGLASFHGLRITTKSDCLASLQKITPLTSHVLPQLRK
jgi:hypothetical protein